MMLLTLHKSVLYASNHGYVHPNETDYEPCHLAGFLRFRGSHLRAFFVQQALNCGFLHRGIFCFALYYLLSLAEV